MPAFPENTLDIQTSETAQNAFRQLSEAPELAVDLEADSMYAFRARLCFVQVGSDSDVFLFDTLVPEVQITVLAPLMLDTARTKFIHAAGEDLKFLAEAGVRVKGLFDTHRAATLLGWPKVGLADLARTLLQIELPKEHQQSDFSLRPLPPSMRVYIANDVRYLLEIGRRVRSACSDAGILEEVLLDCERMADESVGRPEVAPFRPKLPRGNLGPQAQARIQTLATQLHEKRLQWAEAANVPMGRMLSNAAITAIAVQAPQDRKVLARCEGVRGPFVREHGDEVLALVKEIGARAEKGELVLPPAPVRDPKARKREDALKTWRAAKAVERKVTPSVVLSNSTLEDLAKTPPADLAALEALPYFGSKRVQLYGAELVKLLGES
jgi:ribonuclease D